MKPIIALLLAVALAACGQPAALEVADPWTRDTAGRTANAAVFMTITSPVADRLVRASSPVAARTDLMTMVDDGGAMGMIYLEGIDLPAGEPVRLAPTGLHVWLDGLNAPLRAGEAFPLTLEFATAGERQVEVSVIAPAATPPGADMEM